MNPSLTEKKSPGVDATGSSMNLSDNRHDGDYGDSVKVDDIEAACAKIFPLLRARVKLVQQWCVDLYDHDRMLKERERRLDMLAAKIAEREAALEEFENWRRS